MSRHWTIRVFFLAAGAVAACIATLLWIEVHKVLALVAGVLSLVVAWVAGLHIVLDAPSGRRGRFDAVIVLRSDGTAYIHDANKLPGPFATPLEFPNKRDAMDWCDNQNFNFVVKHEQEWQGVDCRSMERQHGSKS